MLEQATDLLKILGIETVNQILLETIAKEIDSNETSDLFIAGAANYIAGKYLILCGETSDNIKQISMGDTSVTYADSGNNTTVANELIKSGEKILGSFRKVVW